MTNWLDLSEGVWCAILFILLHLFITPLTATAFALAIIVWKLTEIKSELT